MTSHRLKTPYCESFNQKKNNSDRSDIKYGRQTLEN